MALSLLQAIQRKRSLTHTPSHDLESIVYVLGYTVLRRLVGTVGCPKDLENHFKECFGKETVRDIAAERTVCQPLSWWYTLESDRPFIMKHTSGVMGGLFRGLQNAVKAVHEETDEKLNQAAQTEYPEMLLVLEEVRSFLTHNVLSADYGS